VAGQVHVNGLMSDYVPPPSGDPPGLPTGDPSVVGDPSGVPDEQQTQQDLPVETDREDEDESPDFVAFPDDQSSVRDEDHRSASPESHAAFGYGTFTNKRLGPAASLASTVAENDSQDVSFSEYGSTLVNEDAIISTEQKGARTAGDPARDSLSPTSTLLTAGQEAGDSVLQAGGTKTLSANRLAISYASASRRILIDAKIVDTLRVFRKEHRIEIGLNVEKGDETELKGIIVSARYSLFEFGVLIDFIQVEVLSDATKKYTPLQLASEAYESDPVFPPLLAAKLPSKLSLVIHLDTEKPIPEARWVKTGDVHEWVRSTFGRIFSDASEGWERKIAVQDPDPVSQRLFWIVTSWIY
jgi:20S proteasome subunit alpha 6